VAYFLALLPLDISKFPMPQMQLPMFPAGAQNVTPEIGFECRQDQVTYFNGHLPVFTHHKTDVQSFRLITAQWIEQGLISQADVVRSFGLSPTTIKRYVKRFRKGGIKALFTPSAKRKGNKLTPERLLEAQQLLNEKIGVPELSRKLGILPTTLHKAIDDGRLRGFKKKKPAS
jgi:transposase